ncbi:MAG: ComEC/Rec2 family competence protein, partial [Phycisphaerae bacterium]
MLTDDLPAASDERAGLLDAIVLGHRSRLGRGLNEIFIRAGCAHFVAVSGLHLAIPMSFVWWLGRRLTLSKSRCAWFMLAVVWAYATIAEPRPPILRAAIVATLYCISLILRRPGTGLSWLSVAAVVVVAVRPQSVFGAGFQLSFSAVLGIMFLTPALGEFAGAVRRMTAQLGRRPLEEWQRRLIDSVGRQSDGWPHLLWRLKRTGRRLIVFPLLVSAGAWLASLPIVWVHFQQLHLWSAVGTLVIFPFVYGVVLLGFLKILLALVVPGMAFLAGVPLVVLQGWLVSIAELMGRAPGTTWEVPPMPWRLVPAWYLFLLLFAWRFRRRRRPIGEESDDRTTVSRPASRWATAGPCGALVLLLTLSTGWWWPAAERGRLVATVLSVGAGSVTVLEMPDGKTVLFDAGGSRSYDVGSHVIVPYLRHRGIRSVDRVYLSHPNLDHFSGLPALLDDVDVGPVVVNPCFRPRCPPGSPARHLLDLLGDLNHPVEVLDPAAREWTLGGARWDRLWPPVGLDASFTTNEASTVLRLTYAGRSILLTGDIEERAQRVLLASASVDQEASLRADVLVLPHHGAVEVNTAAFVH